MNHKKLIILLILIFALSCNSERTQCLKDKSVYSPTKSGDSTCTASLGFIAISVNPRNDPSQRDSNAIDAALLICLERLNSINQCNKKSDIIPATW